MLVKKNKLLPTKIIFSPDEVFDAYVEFLEDQWYFDSKS